MVFYISILSGWLYIRFVKEKIAEKIRIARLGKNLSQQNMADELEITVATYSNIERGVTDITVTRLIQISELLDANPADFLPQDTTKIVVEPAEIYQTSITQQLFMIMQQMQSQQKQLESLQQEIIALKNPEPEVKKKNTRLR